MEFSSSIQELRKTVLDDWAKQAKLSRNIFSKLILEVQTALQSGVQTALGVVDQHVVATTQSLSELQGVSEQTEEV